MSWLTDVYGPRLTNSPGFRKSGEWAVKEMTSWGLANAKLEPCVTPTDRSGAAGRTTSSRCRRRPPAAAFPIIGMSQAWTNGTDGLVAGEAVLAVIETPEDLAKFKGQLKGKFVLTAAMREVPRALDAAGAALRPSRSCELETRDRRRRARPRRRARRRPGRGRPAADAAARRFAAQRTQFLKDEGALAVDHAPAAATAARCFSAAAAANRAAERHRPRAAADRHRRRALRPHRPHAREEACR